MHWIRYLILLTFVFYFTPAITQSSLSSEISESFKVGYSNLVTIDSGRIYKPGASIGSKLHYRPIEIDLWYPAQPSISASTVPYAFFMDLLQQRSNRFQDDTSYRLMTSELVTYLCTNLKVSDTSKLSHLNTSSYLNAIPLSIQSPLILYSCSYNGMSYENIALFEWLASHGYTVASVTSVGRYPGNMSTQLPDLMEQVKRRDHYLPIQ